MNIPKIKILFIFFTAVFLFSLSCSVNIMEEFNKDTDEFKKVEAEKLIEGEDYAGAIAKLEETNTAFRAKRDVAILEAKAYAGKCGLNVMSLATTLENIGAQRLLTILLAAFVGSDDTNIADCKTAEDIVRVRISDDPDERTTDENLTLAFISFAKIGAILNARADSDNDGVVDGGIPNDGLCTNVPFATATLDAENIATGIAIFKEAIIASGSTIAGDVGTTLTDLCADLAALPGDYDFCSIKDPALIIGDKLKGIRTMIQEGKDFGIGTCTDVPFDVNNCACP